MNAGIARMSKLRLFLMMLLVGVMAAFIGLAAAVPQAHATGTEATTVTLSEGAEAGLNSEVIYRGTATVKDASGNVIPGARVVYSYSNSKDGDYSDVATVTSTGTLWVKGTYAGNDTYAPSTSEAVSMTIYQAYGTCGTCTWKLVTSRFYGDSNYKDLVIYPTDGVSGTLDSITKDNVPWNNYDISGVTVKSGVKAGASAALFYDCESLMETDLSGLDTSDTTDMSYMFFNCASYSSGHLDLSSFDTSKVTDMSYMFCNANPESLDLSSFDTSNVTNMKDMFDGCSTDELDLSGFDTTNAATMENAFLSCDSKVIDFGESFCFTKDAAMPKGTWISLGTGTESSATEVQDRHSGTNRSAEVVYKKSSGTAEVTTALETGWSGSYTGRPVQFGGTKSVNGTVITKVGNQVLCVYSSSRDGAYTASAPKEIGTWWVKGIYYDYAYATSVSEPVSFKILKGVNITIASGWRAGYTGSPVEYGGAVTVTDAETGAVIDNPTVTFTYYLSNAFRNMTGQSWDEGGVVSGIASTSVGTAPINARTWYVKATYKGNGVYGQATSAGVSFTIDPAAGTSGTCSWRIDSDGKLDIWPTDGVSGTLGSITAGNAPWYANRSLIKSAVIESGVSAGESASLFDGCSNMASVNLSGLNTSGATSMQSMFDGCSSLASLDVTGFDTTSVTNTASMFNGCTGLASLNLSKLDTSKATDMSSMFAGDTKLGILDLGSEFSFNGNGASTTNSADLPSSGNGNWVSVSTGTTSSAADTINKHKATTKSADVIYAVSSGATATTTALSEVVAGYTGKPIAYGGETMVKYGTNIISDATLTFVYSATKDGVYTLAPPTGTGQWYVKGIYAGDATYTGSTSAATSFKIVGSATVALTPGWSATKTGSPIAYGGTTTVTDNKDGSAIDGATVTYTYYTDADCTTKTTNANSGAASDGTAPANSGRYYVKAAYAGNDTYAYAVSRSVSFIINAASGICGGCSWNIDINGKLDIWPTDGVSGTLDNIDVAMDSSTYARSSSAPWYASRSLIKSAVIENGVKTNEKSVGLFYGCSSMTSVDLSGLDTSGATNMSEMFEGCSSLTSASLSGLDTSKVTSMASMFSGCTGLKSVGLSGLNTAAVTDMTKMFYNCSGLSSINVTSFNTTSVTDMPSMFNGCTGLSSLDLTSFNTLKATNMDSMFAGDTGFAVITLGKDFSFNGNGASTSNPAALPSDSWVSVANGASYTAANVIALHNATARSADTIYVETSSGATSYITLGDGHSLDTGWTAVCTGNPVAYGGKVTVTDAGENQINVSYLLAYSDSQGGTYTTTAPTSAGTWWVKAIYLGGSYNGTTYKSSEGTGSFKIVNNTSTALASGWSTVYTGSPVAYGGLTLVKDANGQNFSGAEVTYTYYTDDACTTLTNASNAGAASEGAAPVNVGTYWVKGTFVGDSIHAGSTSDAVSFKVVKTATTTTLASGWSTAYTGNPVAYGGTTTVTDSSGNEVPGAVVTYTYSDSENGTYTESVPTDTGTWWVKCSYAGDANHEASSATTSFAITSATNKLTRLYGDGRYDTMAAIVQAGFAKSSCQTVILATGVNFPDALSASGLAGLYGSPVVLIDGTLTNASEIKSSQAFSELKRLGAKNVIVIGGKSAVSGEIFDQLSNSYSVSRKSGDSRIETALAVYEAGKGVVHGSSTGWSKTVIIATGAKFADALSVSPLSYSSAMPIMLADEGKLTDSVKTAIESGGFEHAIIVGGTSVVTSDTEAWLVKQFGSSQVVRLSGQGRYSTSAAIADFSCGQGKYSSYPSAFGYSVLSYASAGIATGQNFPDALAGAALCGKRGSVLLLVDDAHKTDDTERSLGIDKLKANKDSIGQANAFGGTSAVSADLYATIEKAIG